MRIHACMPWDSADADLGQIREYIPVERDSRYSLKKLCPYCGYGPIKNEARTCLSCRSRYWREVKIPAKRMLALCAARQRGEIGGESAVYFAKEGGRVTFWFEEEVE